MKRTFKLLVVIFAAATMSLKTASLSAQELDSLFVEMFVPEGYELVDSLVYRYADTADTLLVGKDILEIMPMRYMGGNANVEVTQSERLANSLRSQIFDNDKRTINGYRVRIFFDNRQSARVESEETLKSFEEKYRDIKAYRTYVNPYFKVTVGDCRTRSEAMALLVRIKGDFPTAFVVKESITYPVIDAANAYVVDTVKVLRPISVEPQL